MIHNFNEEKLHRKQETLSHGLSDKELMDLIRQVETEEMIHAPIHLKDHVMTHIRVQRQAVKKRQIFTYRAQVLIAMAAALTVLILMPGEGSNIEKIPQSWQIDQEDADLCQEPLEEKAQKRQQEIDAEWEKYMAQQTKAYERQNFWEGVGERLAAIEERLYNK
ncbi:MAG: hypothetical protein J6K48_03765 [Lachnospiraceae bacterium]|nr:hypothetical protein [Lachnospiraceae bacterium]